MPIERPILRIDWRFALGQVLLIALGVLLGLGANALWSARQDRERERTALGNALDAARTNERRLRQAKFEDTTSYALNGRLLRALFEKGAPAVRDDSMVALFGDGGWWSDGRPIISPFAALLQTGDLNLVRNEKLRAALASYVGEMDARLTAQNDLTRIWQQLILVDRPAAQYVLPALDTMQIGAAYRRDPLVRRQLLTRRSVGNNIIANERIMLRYTTELRMALEQELGVKPIPLPAPRMTRDTFF